MHPEIPSDVRAGNISRGILADPLYLSALASLGPTISAKLAPDVPNRSVAVLPFVNLSGDPSQDFFTDGLTEDIITDLSNAPGFFVIARNSTFAYKGRPTDVRQIAHDLGVKYIIEGSARRSEKRLRINVQLIDAGAGGNHVWAERFDRELSDIFSIQDEVASRVVGAIAGKLGTDAQAERLRPSNIEAYDLVVRSRDLFALSKTANDEAIYQLHRALKLDPNYCEALWRLALATCFSWLHWNEPQVPNRAEALALARRAVEVDPLNAGARWVYGNILSRDKRWEEADAQFKESFRLNPNDSEALMFFADFQVVCGRPQDALDNAAKAFRLNPKPPGWYFWILGRAQVFNGQYELAVETLRREETYRTPSRRFLIAALARLGRLEEAREEGRLFIASNPHWSVGTWAANQAFRRPEDLQFWVETYRMAGLPE